MYTEKFSISSNGLADLSPLDELGYAYCRTNFQGDLYSVNSTFLETFGYNTFDEVAFLNIKKHFYANPESREALLTLLKEKKKVKNYRLIMLKKDGSKIFTQVTKLLSESSGDQYIETYIRDISDIVKKEFELKKEIKSLRESGHVQNNGISRDIKTRFLRETGHGVRTPVTSLLGYLTMLENNLYKSKEEFREIINESKHSVSQLNEAVNSLIDLTRIETENLVAGEDKFDIAEETETFRNSVSAFSGNEARFNVTFQGDAGTILRGDNLRFRQALLNFTRYLSLATSSGTINIDITAKDNNDGTVITSASLRGESGTNLKPVFDKINNYPRSADELYDLESFELGFFIAREYVKILGGSIKIKLSGGKWELGFDVAFKIDSLANENYNENNNPAADIKTNSGKTLNRLQEIHDDGIKRILLVEDDKGNRGVEEKILTNAGYFVFSTENAREAIEELKNRHYDIILMDVAMEEMDGITATKIIRNMPQPTGNIPIIAVTAHCSMQDRQKCLDAGMNDYISKPINFKYLKLTIEQWIKKQENGILSL